MDYASGTVIAKWQWDMIYDPAIVNGVFDDEEEAMKSFFVHGTWSKSTTFENKSILAINDIFKTTTGDSYNWTGDNTNEARQIAAKQLVNSVLNNNNWKDKNDPLVLVGHSHGGNVCILATNMLAQQGKVVDYLITFNTPVLENVYKLNAGSKTIHINVFNNWDIVQVNGGNSINVPDGISELLIIPSQNSAPLIIPIFSNKGRVKLVSGEFGEADRKFSTAINVEIGVDLLTDMISLFHNSHNKSDEWSYILNKFVHPIPNNPSDLIKTIKNQLILPNDNTKVIRIKPIY